MLRVLVADDDRDGTATLAVLLRDQGFEVREVYRGDAVLDQVKQFGPHAVVLDINMPGMSGYDVARELHELYGPACPLLVALTAYDKSSDKILGRLVGFDHYVTKPYDIQHVVGLLKSNRLGKKSG